MSDNGTEFVNNTLTWYLYSHGIIHTRIPTYSPTINGKVERVNCTIIEGARSLLLSSQVPMKFISYAAQHVCSWYNLLPQENRIQSPYELLNGSSYISIDILHPFGCRVSFQISSARRGGASKVEPIARDDIFLGFKLQAVVGYIIYDPAEERIITTTNVFFSDNVCGFEKPLNIDQFNKWTEEG